MIRNLNSRERVMLGVVLSIVVLFGVSLMLASFRRSYTTAKEEVVTKRQELQSIKEVLKERDLWQEREVWLGAKQPVMENRDRAGVELLDEVRSVAKSQSVQIEKPEIAAATREPSHEAVKVSLETRSDWPSLIRFLNELQQPGRFIVLEEADLRIDAANPSGMHGRFRIAKWYAPGQ